MYTVNVRMNNPGPAKFLIDSAKADDVMSAFYKATEMKEKAGRDHFVEVVDDSTGNSVELFKEDH